MAYDEELAERVRALMGLEVEERRMFGGLAFLVEGTMAVAVSGRGGLMVRLPDEEVGSALEEPHVEPMLMSGRAVRGWVLVSAEGCAGDDLGVWVGRGVEHARTLGPV